MVQNVSWQRIMGCHYQQHPPFGLACCRTFGITRLGAVASAVTAKAAAARVVAVRAAAETEEARVAAATVAVRAVVVMVGAREEAETVVERAAAVMAAATEPQTHPCDDVVRFWWARVGSTTQPVVVTELADLRRRIALELLWRSTARGAGRLPRPWHLDRRTAGATARAREA